MSYWGYKPYVSVAKRREQAEKLATKAKKSGQDFAPVRVSGRAIAKTFWGKAWCDNLEAYSDFENRLPRGRTYVRNGAVIDLKIEPGKVRAQVVGSSLYRIEINITAVSAAQWRSLASECTGSINSLVELLQGKLSKAVMERICQPKSGLFPAPKEITLACSCPDWATMCKHVAATLYGVGARLDEQPELLFTLRQVDASELVTQAAQAPGKSAGAVSKGRVLDDDALGDVFGIEMAEVGTPVKATKAAKATKAVTPTKEVRAAKATSAAPTKPAIKKSALKKAVATATKQATTKVTKGQALKKVVAKKGSAKAPTSTPKASAKRSSGKVPKATVMPTSTRPVPKPVRVNASEKAGK